MQRNGVDLKCMFSILNKLRSHIRALGAKNCRSKFELNLVFKYTERLNSSQTFYVTLCV